MGGKQQEDVLRGTMLEQAELWLSRRADDLDNEVKFFVKTGLKIRKRDLLILEILTGQAHHNELGSVYLVGAKLIRANLREAFLQKADMSKADLRQAQFREANLKEVNLRPRRC
ncbi:MAG: pentapeptide repeat-containing protein [Chloroflexota bacterium]